MVSVRQKLDKNKKSADKLSRDLDVFSKYFAQLANTAEKSANFVKRHPHVVAGMAWLGHKIVGYKHPDVTRSVADIVQGESIDDVVDKLLRPREN